MLSFYIANCLEFYFNFLYFTSFFIVLKFTQKYSKKNIQFLCIWFKQYLVSMEWSEKLKKKNLAKVEKNNGIGRKIYMYVLNWLTIIINDIVKLTINFIAKEWIISSLWLLYTYVSNAYFITCRICILFDNLSSFLCFSPFFVI